MKEFVDVTTPERGATVFLPQMPKKRAQMETIKCVHPVYA